MSRHLSVLVVDDRQHDVEIVKRLLVNISGMDFTIHTANSPEMADDILAHHDIELLILDHKLSSSTGDQFLAENSFHREMPVIIISGFLSADEAMELYEQGAYTYLEKDMLTPHTLQIGISNSIYRHGLEQSLRKSLEHKDRLLKEVHHRVKNNMQVICSLLGLQAGDIADDECRQLLNDSKQRVLSMGQVHRILYESDDFSHIDAGIYLENLVEEIARSLIPSDRTVQFDYEMDSGIDMGLDTAIPCGLIVNELVTNALRHAVREDTDPTRIEIRLHQSQPGSYRLAVADNGPGLPPDVEPRSADSLGLQLVLNLAEGQLGGDVNIDSSNGTTVRIEFDALEPRMTGQIFEPDS